MTTAFEREQASEMERAKVTVAELGHALRAAGWDLVVLRLTRILDDGAGNCASAGATYATAGGRTTPTLRLEADGLRSVAETFEKAFTEAEVEEATEGYSEDVTREVGL
jgi:hypothetical protein